MLKAIRLFVVGASSALLMCSMSSLLTLAAGATDHLSLGGLAARWLDWFFNIEYRVRAASARGNRT
jgi:hypothetical protein